MPLAVRSSILDDPRILRRASRMITYVIVRVYPAHGKESGEDLPNVVNPDAPVSVGLGDRNPRVIL